MFRNLITALTLTLAADAALGQLAGPPPVRSFDNASSADSRPQSSSTANIPRYATRNRHFTIPFTVVDSHQPIVSLRLFVSEDRGIRWRECDQAEPRQSEFNYQASGDGEFWFAVQTIDRTGEKRPARIALADLVVVVDTLQPTIAARAGTDAAGRVTLDWEARDDYLATDSLAIRIRPAGSGPEVPWTNVPCKVTRPPTGPMLQDQYAFWPEIDDPNLDVEVSIRDQAGNQATTSTIVYRQQVAPRFADLNPGRRPETNPSGSNWSPRSNAPATGGNGQTQPGPTQDADERNAVLSRDLPVPDSVPSQSGGSTQSTARPEPVEWESVRHSATGNFSSLGSTQGEPAKPLQMHPIQPPASIGANGGDLLARQDNPAVQSPPVQQSPARLATDREFSLSEGEPRSVLEQPPVSPEVREQTISINSKRFRLNFQVDEVDPAGVKEVAVWATKDGGKSWGRLGAIPSTKGPYPMEVDSSGLYGFRLVVIGNSGIKSRLPQPGDPADQWVRVDVDPPTAKIIGAPVGTGEDAGKLVIQWEASDELLAIRPVDLSYSTRPEGPWTTIEKGLRNSGHYAWSVNPDAPQMVFLKLVVRDAAGNESTDQTSYPVDISSLYPRGRILGVEAVHSK